jgi:hypothetical protein
MARRARRSWHTKPWWRWAPSCLQLQHMEPKVPKVPKLHVAWCLLQAHTSKLMPACPGRLNTCPEHAMTPSMALGIAAFKAFLSALQENQVYYGPVLGWAWVRGLRFEEVKQDGFDTYMVPCFGTGEYDQVGEEWMLRGQSMQHHDMSHSGRNVTAGA